MLKIQAQEIILFPLLQYGTGNYCKNCSKNMTFEQWNVCLSCLRSSGKKAQLTCYICVDCFKTPTDWLYQKAHKERLLRDQGLSEVHVVLEYMRAGQCPVCEIRRSQQCSYKQALDRNKEGLGVSYDDALEIKARKISSEYEFKRKRRAEWARKLDYAIKIDVIEKLVIKTETKQLKTNESDAKIKKILRYPSLLHSKSELEDSNDEL